MERSRGRLQVIGLVLVFLSRTGHAANLQDPWGAADAKLTRVYQWSVSSLPVQDQESLRVAERAWITFTEKNEKLLIALRTSGFLTPSVHDRLVMNELDHRSDQLQIFFLGGPVQEEDSRPAKDRADQEIQTTYDEFLKKLPVTDQALLRESQRAWLIYRDADADSCVVAARRANRTTFRGFAAKVHLTRLRNAQLRMLSLSPKSAPQEQLRPPPQQPTADSLELQKLTQVKEQAKEVLGAFMSSGDSGFFAQPSSLKAFPEVPTPLNVRLSALNSTLRSFQMENRVAAGIGDESPEAMTLDLLEKWGVFAARLKTGTVDEAVRGMQPALDKLLAGLSSSYAEIWKVAERWKPICFQDTKEYQDHVNKAKQLAEIGKNSEAIHEYEAAYKLIENNSIPKLVKKLRDQTLGL